MHNFTIFWYIEQISPFIETKELYSMFVLLMVVLGIVLEHTTSGEKLETTYP